MNSLSEDAGQSAEADPDIESDVRDVGGTCVWVLVCMLGVECVWVCEGVGMI